MSDSMIRMRLRVDILTEVAARSSLPIRNRYMSSDYIDNTKMRGAILTAIRRRICPYDSLHACNNCHDRASCEFIQKVIPGVVNVSAVLPICGCDSPIPIGRSPFTFFTCKICSEVPHDGTRSMLIDQDPLAIRYCARHSEPFLRMQFKKPICLHCKKPLPTPDIKMRPGLEIDDTVGSAKRGQLYFTETLSYMSTQLMSDLIITDDAASFVHDVIDEDELVQIGAGRGKGWGMIRMESIESEKKIETLVDELVPIVEKMIEEEYIIMFARTPIATISMDDNGLSSVPHVKEVCGLKLVRGYGRTTNVSGWSLKSNLQRPIITAADVGSAFVYKPNGNISNSRDIARLEFLGLGQEMMRNTQLNQIVFWRE